MRLNSSCRSLPLPLRKQKDPQDMMKPPEGWDYNLKPPTNPVLGVAPSRSFEHLLQGGHFWSSVVKPKAKKNAQ